VVLHTTETETIPGYLNGEVAPHLTYDPANDRWVQHNSFVIAGRALFNGPGGGETNRQNALQVEIVCYSDKGIADKVDGIWVGDLEIDHIAAIRAFIDWCVDNYDVKLKWPGKQALSYGGANAPGFRMTMSAWEAFDGVCGHQHIPENYHWDPGALDWATLMAEEEEEVVTPEDISKIASASATATLNKLTKPVGDAPVGQGVWQYGGVFDNDDPTDNAQRTLQRVLIAVNDLVARVDELDGKINDLLETEPE